jgi:hypothetical protein
MRTTVHRVSRSTRKWMSVRMGVAFIGLLPAVAFAEPSSGVTTTTFVPTADFVDTVHINNDRIKFQTKEATDVRIQKLEFAFGSSSGWHHHPGVIIVTVAVGQVTVWDSECHTTTYGPGLPDGAVFVEGGDEPGRVTSNGATNYATQIAPSDNPLPVRFRIEDDPPPCAH